MGDPIFVCADAHLSNALPYARRLNRGEALEGTDRLHDVCEHIYQSALIAVESGVTRALFLGDFLDRARLDGVTDYWARKLLVRLRDLGLKIDLVPGNHEADDRAATAFSISSYAVDFEGVRVLLDGPGEDGIWPMAFRPEARATKALLGLSTELVPFIHQTIRGACVGVWDSPTGVNPEVLARFRWVVSGHFHTTQPIMKPAKGLYLGANVQHHFGDAGQERSCWIVDAEEEIAERIVVPSPQFCELSMSANIEGALAEDAIRKALEASKKGYVRIQVKGEPSQISRFRNDCEDAFTAMAGEEYEPREFSFSFLPSIPMKDRLGARSAGDVRKGSVAWKAVVSQWVEANACDAHGADPVKLFELGERLIVQAGQDIGFQLGAM